MKHVQKYLLIVVPFLLLLNGCRLEEPSVTATTVSANEKLVFSRLVALGDNIIAGYQNAALVDTVQPLQRYSFVAQIARQAGNTNFVQPSIAYPGLGSESLDGFGVLELKHLDNPKTPDTVIPDPVVWPAAFDNYPDFDWNDPFLNDSIKVSPFNNLGIPGIVTQDILVALTRLQSISHSGLIDVVLRNPDAGNLTPIEQAKAFYPSTIALWIGMYDIMRYAIYSSHGPVISQPTPVEEFSEHFKAILDSVSTLMAPVIVGNIPDFIDAPYFHSVSPFVVDSVTNLPYLDEQGNKVPLIGLNPDSDLVLFPAKQPIREGYGIPTGIMNGNGNALQPEFVLDIDEQQTVLEHIEGYNNAIAGWCAAYQIPVVDMYALFKDVKEGYPAGGFTFTADYITGGFYSLDGLHPSSLGNGLIANKWIESINSNFNSGSFYVSLPPVDIIGLMNELPPIPSGK